jgi:poly(glycerol-phosphate) alpha-glucosyltransferase
MLDPWALRASRGKKLVARLLFQQRHFKGAACIHALNDSELRSIRAYGLRNPVCVIPNGIDVPEIGGQRSEVGGLLPIVSGLKAGGRKVLLYLGRIHPKKGLVNLLGSWAETAKHRCTGASDWVLAIAGWDDGGHQAKLLHLCEELGLPVCRCFGESVELETDVLTHGHTNVPAREASVVFLGPQFGEAKHACYRYCDAFILPSFSEGLPMAVLEAWSFAKPVVMTPECNLPEGFAAGAAIRIEQEAEGKDKGAASRGETARSIEAGLGELFDASESRLHTLGENGRKLVADRFAWPGIARQMKSVYDWVLGGGEPPTCVRFAEGRQRPSRSER